MYCIFYSLLFVFISSEVEVVHLYLQLMLMAFKGTGHTIGDCKYVQNMQNNSVSTVFELFSENLLGIIMTYTLLAC